VAKAAQVLSIPGFTSEVTSFAFSPDGKILVTGSNDPAIRVWDLSGKKVNEMDLVAFGLHLAFSPDGRLLAIGTSDGTLSLWNTSIWKQVIIRPASSAAVVGLAFTPDSKDLVTGTAEGMIHFGAVTP
jgi:WD40 repeat protein